MGKTSSRVENVRTQPKVASSRGLNPGHFIRRRLLWLPHEARSGNIRFPKSSSYDDLPIMELSLLIYLWELIHYHHRNFLKIKAAPGQKRTELKDIILPSHETKTR